MLSNKEKQLIKKEETFCSNTYNPLPVVLKKGKGVYVWDVHCKKYLDFLSSYSAVNKIKTIITHYVQILELYSNKYDDKIDPIL